MYQMSIEKQRPGEILILQIIWNFWTSVWKQANKTISALKREIEFQAKSNELQNKKLQNQADTLMDELERQNKENCDFFDVKKMGLKEIKDLKDERSRLSQKIKLYQREAPILQVKTDFCEITFTSNTQEEHDSYTKELATITDKIQNFVEGAQSTLLTTLPK